MEAKITVCDHCFEASCWEGVIVCGEYETEIAEWRENNKGEL